MIILIVGQSCWPKTGLIALSMTSKVEKSFCQLFSFLAGKVELSLKVIKTLCGANEIYPQTTRRQYLTSEHQHELSAKSLKDYRAQL